MKLWIYLLIIGYASVAAGCGSKMPYEPSIHGKPINRVEIYYRDFTVLSYMPYADEHLIRTHDVALEIEDNNRIMLVVSALPKQCELLTGKEEEKENLYALFRLYGVDRTHPVLVYRFSRFSYTTSASGSLCSLGSPQREAIRGLVAKLREMEAKKNFPAR